MFEKFRNFMQDRYGFDKLGFALIAAAFIISFLSRLLWIPELYLLTIILDIIFIYRFLSKKTYARSRENQKFNECFQKVKEFISRDRQNYRYCRCPVCKTNFAVPKNSGNSKAVCPKCGNIL